MLNLRRTLHRVVDLATERFGSWAALVLDLGDRVTVVSAGTGAQPELRTVRARHVGADVHDRLAALAARSLRPVGADALPGSVVTAPATAQLVPVELLTQEADVAVLLVADPVRPKAELLDFARRAARAVTAAQIYDERTTLAATLRSAVVPPPLPEVDGLDLGASFRPALEATQVGGDFYEVSALPGGHWALTVGDVRGKGVGAAVLTGQVRQSLRTAGLVTTEPAAALALLNDTMLASGGEDFVTVVHMRLCADGSGVEVVLSTGGHPPPLLLRRGTVSDVAVSGTLVGMRSDASFGTATVRLDDGDVLLAYTDGAVEAHGASGMLGLDPLVAELADCAGLPAQTVADRLMQRVLVHLDGRRHDDIAFVAVRPAAGALR